MSIGRHVALAIVAAALPAATAAAQTPPSLGCGACAVAGSDGQIMWGSDVAEPLPNASTTKIVTALVVVEETQPEEEVTVSPEAASTPGGYLELEAGDVLTVDDLLHGLLMASSNDAAVALAEHVAGTEEEFVALMNRKAEQLGARDSNFVTPHGLDAEGHVSSARDLVTFATALLDDPALAAIAGRTGYTLGDGTGITNSNPLLEGYEGATGIKTGMTLQGGEVLVASARRPGAHLIAVALGSPDASADAAALLDHGFLLTRRTARAIARAARAVSASARGVAGAVEAR